WTVLQNGHGAEFQNLERRAVQAEPRLAEHRRALRARANEDRQDQQQRRQQDQRRNGQGQIEDTLGDAIRVTSIARNAAANGISVVGKRGKVFVDSHCPALSIQSARGWTASIAPVLRAFPVPYRDRDQGFTAFTKEIPASAVRWRDTVLFADATSRSGTARFGAADCL